MAHLRAPAPLPPILRDLVALLEEAAPGSRPAERLRDRVRQYVDRAHLGVTLEMALEIDPAWHEGESRKQQWLGLLRELFERFEGSDTGRCKAAEEAARRYAARRL